MSTHEGHTVYQRHYVVLPCVVLLDLLAGLVSHVNLLDSSLEFWSIHRWTVGITALTGWELTFPRNRDVFPISYFGFPVFWRHVTVPQTDFSLFLFSNQLKFAFIFILLSCYCFGGVLYCYLLLNSFTVILWFLGYKVLKVQQGSHLGWGMVFVAGWGS